MADQNLEVWQRGPVPDVPPLLQPVAHALLQAREELAVLLQHFPDSLLWERPAGVASPGFHLQHLSGVLDRVFTYARGEALTAHQLEQLHAEDIAPQTGVDTNALLTRFNQQVDEAIAQLKNTDEKILTAFRGVGRKQLPSTVIGLLVHGAEHTMRHVGQLMVTVKFLQHNNTKK
ncbi:MAG: metal-dependent hydrolase [Ferruginibacter sp.]|uniref:DinB family protein n=1 Tax=Ferruginibacter sp. TaxID=1940288 RepID=UPI0026588AEF|nr:DinB family protein [Ferruginibacter sp.]MDB5276781.1 metal-dependent hydrolase [Ferruginibacter sp.]